MNVFASRKSAFLILPALALAWAAAQTRVQGQDSSSKAKTVDVAAADRVIAAAKKQAGETGVPMNIAVVGPGGHLKAFARMDGAFLGSVDISINKAFTARMFNTESGNLAAASQSGGPLFGIHGSNDGRIVIFAGGVPLKDANGTVVGAIGVSGGSVEQDQEVAKAGAAAF